MARWVVKLGTSVLSEGTDRLSRARMVDLMRQIALLKSQEHEVVLVSSGAVLAGWEHLNYPERKYTLPEKQMLAAVGQSQLMHLYTQLAAIYHLKVAQTLLIRSDFRDRRRYLNARTTLHSCLSHGVVPIVNENDVVAIEEIQLGDNDTLAAHVASLVEADMLLIATDIDGLYTAPPQKDPEAQLIPCVEKIDASIWELAGGAGSLRGTGGMQTKIKAAEIATRSGVLTCIAAGSESDLLLRLSRGEKLGTEFLPQLKPLEARKRWIMADVDQEAYVVVDQGAQKAICERGGSLLPVGVKKVSGDFEKGQTIRVVDAAGEELARGLSRYHAREIDKVKGCASEQVESVLGYQMPSELIHRNDMILV